MIFYIERINTRVAVRGSVAECQNNPYKEKWPTNETVIIIKSGLWSSALPHLIRLIIRSVSYENSNLVKFHENEGVELHSRRQPDWL